LFRDNFMILYKNDYKLFACNFFQFENVYFPIDSLIKALVFNEVFIFIVIKGVI
jgi:hypothetical protein